MIEIFNSNSEKIMSFKDYDALLEYIEEIERDKQFEDRLELNKEHWNFTIRSNQSLSTVYWRAIKATNILLTDQEQSAYEQGYNLLEMCKGKAKNMNQVILTPDIDIEDLKRSWCKDYCSEHGYTFIETRH
jgi:hypothetical protein